MCLNTHMHSTQDTLGPGHRVSSGELAFKPAPAFLTLAHKQTHSHKHTQAHTRVRICTCTHARMHARTQQAVVEQPLIKPKDKAAEKAKAAAAAKAKAESAKAKAEQEAANGDAG